MYPKRGNYIRIAGRLLFCCGLTIALPMRAATLNLEIQGAEDALLDNLRLGLSLAEEPCDAPAWRVRRLLERAEEEMQRSARALGYYRLQVEGRSLEREENCWQARFQVAPGARVQITELDIQIRGDAGDDAAFDRVIRESPLRPGIPLNHGQYEQLKRDIERLALERGYFEGRFARRELRVDPETGSATVHLHYASGPRYRVSELNLKQETYAPSLLERYLTFEVGDPYDSGKLNALHRALSDSGYFERVAVRPDLEAATDGQVPVNVELEPRKAVAYRFGIGVATDTGPRLSAEYERRRLNRFGHRFELSTQLAPVDSSLEAQYLIPYNTPHTEQIGIHVAYRHQDTAAALSDSYIVGLREVGKRGGWNEVRSLEWINEESNIDGKIVDATLLVPAVSWSRTEADDRIRPRRGHRLTLNLRGGASALFSDTDFVQATAGFKWIRGLGKGRLLLRGDGGITAVEQFDRLPASYRYFAGGDQSVRGYEYQSLAPEDSAGRVDGGRYLLTGSVEYEYPINDKWALAGFVDAGNAFDSLGDDLKQGVGLGLRWHSPVGPVRVDLAFPSDTSADDFRIHFSMGPDL